MKPTTVKQFIGMAVKAILAVEGWKLDDTGVRIYDDSPFRSGATYSKFAEEEVVDDSDLLDAMLSSLSETNHAVCVILSTRATWRPSPAGWLSGSRGQS